jgi:hypothetical protein
MGLHRLAKVLPTNASNLLSNAPHLGLLNGKSSSKRPAGSAARKKHESIRMVVKKMKKFKKNNEQPGH